MDLSSLESQLFWWWWWWWWCWWRWGWWWRRWNTKTEKMGNYWRKFWSKVINETLGCINLTTPKRKKNLLHVFLLRLFSLFVNINSAVFNILSFQWTSFEFCFWSSSGVDVCGGPKNPFPIQSYRPINNRGAW